MAEYITDNEGNPASLAGESTGVSIQAGMPPQWVYFPVAVPFFGEGNWLTVQSGCNLQSGAAIDDELAGRPAIRQAGRCGRRDEPQSVTETVTLLVIEPPPPEQSRL